MTARAGDDILAVARVHGTRVAAEWAGVSPSTVVKLRREVDGYDRGRGHPTRAEIAAMAPRLDCGCGRCVDWRSDEATSSEKRWAATRRMVNYWAGPVPVWDQQWRSHAACAGQDTDDWFPARGASLRHLRAICDACPVKTECAEFALEHRIPEGVFGGLSAKQRRRILRDRGVELELAS